ncbi:MAG: DNA-processing protein DprA [Chloroflexi bacterium]|nr:DNA-processing protein DprA [Chloroflexota bacterium]
MVEANTERAQWVALRRAGLGSESFRSLIAYFGSIAEAWEAPSGAGREAGLRAQYVRGFERARREFAPEQELEALEQHGVRTLTWEDEAYPSLLQEIPQSPPVLFVRGSSGPQFEQALAVVGTRRVTPYGREVCEQYCGAVARAGVAIVSGLARGIDSIAHRVAVDEGAPTVAVLAGGIDGIYPKENAGLAERVMGQGCVVSEYPPGVKTRADYFPRRNRIISGLARATLVIEAGMTSGALHTAHHALEQNREVFATPGSVFSQQSVGTNRLIRESAAKLVGSAEELCEELNLLSIGQQLSLGAPPPAEARTDAAPSAPVETSTEEGRVLHWLEEGPLHVDEVARRAELPVQVVTGALLTLELRGLVRQQEPLTYLRMR